MVAFACEDVDRLVAAARRIRNDDDLTANSAGRLPGY
ncbi:DUF7692 domain-containing protein [Natronorubrum sp. DTA7]